MSRTPTAAARCTVTSHRSTHSETRGESSADPTRYSNPGFPVRCEMLSMLPVDRSSSTSTLSPRSNSRSERWEPMKPAPPEMKTFMVTLAPSAFSRRSAHVVAPVAADG